MDRPESPVEAVLSKVLKPRAVCRRIARYCQKYHITMFVLCMVSNKIAFSFVIRTRPQADPDTACQNPTAVGMAASMGVPQLQCKTAPVCM